MIKVTVEGKTGEGVIWKGSMQSIPTAGDWVCVDSGGASREVKSVDYDLNTGDVLIRVR